MIPAIIVSGHLAVAVADRPPELNFELACRETATGEIRKNDVAVCIADEKRVRDQLAAQWSSFDPAARTRCARASTSAHAASYLELLVCLELEQADRDLRGQGSGAGLSITEPRRPTGEREGPTDSIQGRPGPVAAPSRPAPVAAPSRPAPMPRSLQPQSEARSTGVEPAAPAPAEPLPISPPPPTTAPQSTSQPEVLRQSICRSPLGYVVPGC